MTAQHFGGGAATATPDELRNELEAGGATLPDVLEARARAHPDRPLLYYGEDDVRLTYGQTLREVESLAGNLARAGVRPGDRISVFLRNPMATTLWMFGIWRAGAVFCPVNYAYTGRLLAYQINDTAPVLVVTERSLVEAVSEVANELAVEGLRITVRDAPDDAHDAVPPERRASLSPELTELAYDELTAPADAPDHAVAWDDPASIFYTSGTTGPPKGVLHLHRWANQYLYAVRLVADETDVIYSDMPMYHVGGAIYNAGRAVWVGASCAQWDHFSASGFWDRIRRSGATQATLVDVTVPWLLNAPPREDDRDHTLDKVHLQPLSARMAELTSRFGINWVSAGFGQTEAGMPLFGLVDALADDADPPRREAGLSSEAVRELARARGIPVRTPTTVEQGFMGHVTPFAEVTVLDDRDQPTAPGEVGQLAVRPRLAGTIVQEYVGKPDATLGAFRNLWFHTGDAAFVDEAGTFRFVDRLGSRMRVRGENLSSFEVEDHVTRHEGVRVCAAFPVPSDDGEEDDIVVCCVPTVVGELTADEVRAWCADHLPRYMRPRYVRIVDELPRTPTNKIEKYKLKEQFLATDG
jgi:carnitine-CoA ligase